MTSDGTAVDDGLRRLGRRLAALRCAGGRTQAELATLTGYSRSTLAGVETGRQHVDVGFWRRCDEVLSTSGEFVGAHAHLEQLRERRRRDLSRAARIARAGPWTAPIGTPGASSPDAAPLPTRSQAPMPGDAAAPFTVGVSDGAERRADVISSAAGRARSFTSSVELTNVGAADLEQLADDVRYLAVAYQQVPLDVLLDDIVAAQQHAFGLLEGHQRPAQAVDLFLLAGVVSGLMARVSHDVGDVRGAMAQARAARVCADNAGHGGLRVWARGLQALIAYWAGDLTGSVHHARRGLDAVGDRPSTAAVWAASGLARSCAALGLVADSRTASQAADELRTRVRPDELDALGGVCRFDVPRQLYYTAEASAWGGAAQAARAQTLALDALVEYDRAPAAVRAVGDEAGARCALATARLNGGDPEGALDAISPVLALSAAHRTHGVRAAVAQVARTLDGVELDVPVLATMREAVLAFPNVRLDLRR